MSEQLIESVNRSLLAIQVASLKIPAQEVDDVRSVASFDACSRSRKFNQYGYHLLNDGLVVMWTTDEFLEYRSHRLAVPRVGDDFRYHREPFDVDCQKLPSKRINVSGVEDIAPVVKITDLEEIQRESWQCAQVGWVGLITVRQKMADC